MRLPVGAADVAGCCERTVSASGKSNAPIFNAHAVNTGGEHAVSPLSATYPRPDTALRGNYSETICDRYRLIKGTNLERSHASLREGGAAGQRDGEWGDGAGAAAVRGRETIDRVWDESERTNGQSHTDPKQTADTHG